VVQDAIGNDDIETGWSQGRSEQVDLNEMGVVDRKTIPEILSQSKRVHAQIGANTGPAPAHSEEVRHLASAAPDLENFRSMGDLLIEQAGENPFARFASKTIPRV
jgi:hypothetical protein